MKNISKIVAAFGGATLVTGLLSPTLLAQDEEWDTAGFVENATYYRDGPDISKSRTTGQYEFSKDLGFKIGRAHV